MADVEACWSSFKDKIRDAVDKFIPILHPRRRKISSFMRKETIKLINKREKLFSVYHTTNRLTNLDRYKLVRSLVNGAIHLDKVSETKAKLFCFKESNNAFYGYVRSKQKVRSHFVQLRKKDNILTDSHEEAANELSSFYVSICKGM